MKFGLFLCIAASAVISRVTGSCTDLYITGIVTGPVSGNPKAIELYAGNDIADLSVFCVHSAANGAVAPASCSGFRFPAVSVTAGTYIHIATTIESFNAFFGFDPDYANSVASHNGDDSFILFRGGAGQTQTIEDYFGKPYDGGSSAGTSQSWNHVRGWAYRKQGTVAMTSFSEGDWNIKKNAWPTGTQTNTGDFPFPLKTFSCQSGGGGNPTTPAPVVSTPAPVQSPVVQSVTLISAIQGTGSSSPLVNQVVTIEAVVVGDFQQNDADEARKLQGFFVQEEDSDADADPKTSEGIFVFEGNALIVDVKIGDVVRVTGTVREQFSETQISATTVTIISTASQLPTPATVTFPQSTDDLEAFEGMRVTITNTMTINEMFQLKRFNEIMLYNGNRPYQYTQLFTPDATGYAAHVAEIGRNRITYDDGLSVQNADINFLDGFKPFTTATAYRMGDTVTSLTGVLRYAFNLWRVVSTVDGSVSFTRSNPRPKDPPSVGGGNIKMVSFNVLNFFTTFSLPSSMRTGPNMAFQPRGAQNQAEFDRQLQKLITVLAKLDADVLALIELENDFDGPNSALNTLVTALNNKVGDGTYAAVYPGTRYVGTDAIACGFMYKPSKLQPVGTPAILDDGNLPQGSTAPIFSGPNSSRAPIAVTFQVTSSNECITLSANHLKSKGGTGTGEGNVDLNNGVASWNQRRLDAVVAMTTWLATEPTGFACPNRAILGDLNAYYMEDPIQYLLNTAGYVNVKPKEDYSYVFDGQLGTLDYVLVNQALSQRMTGSGVWHVSEDEADALDYQLRFNRNPGYFDGNSVARPSDHSPVLVGLDLTSSGPTSTTPAPIVPATPAPVVQPTPTTPAPIAPATPAPVVQPVTGSCTDLYITGSVTATRTSALPKAIELYAGNDIADLSVFCVHSAANGAVAPASCSGFRFPAVSVTAGTYIHIATTIESFNAFFGFDPDYANSVASHNGDDSFILFRGGAGQTQTIEDYFGKPYDGGSSAGTSQSWNHVRGWAYRKQGTVAMTSFSEGDWNIKKNAWPTGTQTNTGDFPFPLKTFSCQSGGGGNPTTPAPVVSTPAPVQSPVVQSVTLISAIQGTGSSSPLVNQVVTIEAVVVGDFQQNDADEARKLQGFFVQEEDSDADADPKTSEGIFVFEGNALIVDVKIGDVVRVTGTVREQFSETQISATTVTIISTASQLPTPATVTFPQSTDDLEAFEGMRVTITNTMTINEMFQLKRFNEIMLYNGNRPYQYTQLFTPDATGYAAHVAEIGRNRITYDDGLSVQNADINFLDGFKPFTTATAYRMGDTVTSLTGVLRYAFNLWRVVSTVDGSVSFTRSNPRPKDPPSVGGGNIKMVSFNVLNFFTTFSLPSSMRTGPNMAFQPRGAQNQAEFDRQLQKLITVLAKLDADVLALIELENDFDGPNSALNTLVTALNNKVGDGTYAAVYPGTRYVGTDAIACGFMYKPSKLQPVGTPAILDDGNLPQGSTAPIFSGPNSSRAPIAVTFQVTSSNECITLSANHLKSKGGTGTGEGNVDLNNGVASWNQRRLDAVVAMTTWLATEPTGFACPNRAILGDLNAYYMEDPIQYLLNTAGYVNVKPKEDYSYVFDGQLGTLDYVLVNQALSQRMTGSGVWHVSEDEADALDYQLRFNRNPGYFDGNSVARPSDHSPVLVGLDLTSSGPTSTTPAPIVPATPAPVVQPTPTTPAPIAPATPAPVVQPVTGSCTDLYITGSVTATRTSALPKAIELYAGNDIADLSVFCVHSAANGAVAPASCSGFRFPAVSVTAGTYIHIATTIESFNAFFGFDPDYANSVASHNGDDSFILFRGGAGQTQTIEDYFGKPYDGGSSAGTSQSWNHVRGWAYRKQGTVAMTSFSEGDWNIKKNAWPTGTQTNTGDFPFPLKTFSCQSGGGGNPTTPAPVVSTPAPVQSPVVQSVTLISAIQGTGSSSPLVNQVVTIEAVVVGDFQQNDADEARKLQGFFVQEEDSDADADPKTSEGIFVFEGNALIVDVKIGDVVRVTGTVREQFSETQISATTVTIISTASQLPTPATVTFPQSTDDLEAFEGMRVTITNTMTINEMFQLKRFNEIMLYNGNRPYQYTQLFTPDATGYAAHVAEIGRNRITYDDGLSVQNADINFLDGFKPFTTATAYRMGDTVTSLTGVLRYAFNLWRVVSTVDGSVSFTRSNPRPKDPPSVGGGNIKMVSFNVLNFFTTFSLPSSMRTGPNMAFQPRGAQNQAEFDRQLQKLITVLAKLDADVLALIELENDFDGPNSALNTLVTALNNKVGDGTYAAVYPGTRYVGTDAIACGFMYKPSKLQPVGTPAILDDGNLPQGSTAPIFSGPNSSRAPIAVTFQVTSSNECITLSANHLKSKGGTGTGEGNVDLNNGVASWNQRRLDAVVAMTTWLATEPTGFACPNRAILGDLNAYYMEDPIQYLLNTAGYVNVKPKEDYSYVFDGQLGTLDYVLVNQALSQRMTGSGVWHVSEDEADALDYQLRFNRNPGYFDGNSVARPSDHSPVLVGLDLTSSGPTSTTPAPIVPATPAPVVQPTPTTPAPIAPATPAPVVQPVTGSCTDLYITGSVTATRTSALPKAIELYAGNDIADLSVFCVHSAANGAVAPASCSGFRFPAVSVTAGTYIHIATTIESFNAFFGFDPDYANSVASHNGDDSFILFRGGAGQTQTIEDYFGKPYDGGSSAGTSQSWNHVRGWAYRKQGTVAMTSFSEGDWNIKKNAWPTGTQTNTGDFPFPLKTFSCQSGGGGNPTTPAPVVSTPAPVQSPVVQSVTLISAIQGTGSSSPLVNQVVTIEAVVVGDFQQNDADEARKLQGFFVQEEDSDADADPKTSEGIFVFEGNALIVDVKIGDVVRVTGTVREQFSETQISATTVTIISTASQLPTPATVTFPQSTDDLEAFEGMRVTITNTMTINEMFQLKRFNEIMLYNGNRPYQYTQLFTPDATGYAAHVAEIGRNRITYDDGLSVQNADINFLDGFKPFTTATAYRMGDTVTSLTGVLRYAFNLWRVVSTVDGSVSFTRSNPRPKDPPSVGGGNIKMVSFNVLNFFTTFSLPSSMRTGPNMAFQPRGAQNQAEFDRQLQKLITVLAKLDADVLALIELENDFDGPNSALNTLVTALNNKVGDGTYAAVYPGTRYVGTDAIACGFMYKPSKLQPVGTPAILDDGNLPQGSTAPIFSGPNSSRAPIAVTFQVTSSNECITLSANHLKSKGGTGTGEGNVDLNNGVASWNQRRLDAVVAMTTWLATEPTGFACPNRAILGDLNAYYMEDPIQYLLNTAGYVNVKPKEDYSYVFDGQLGTLDYVLVNQALSQRMTGSGVWHVSEDEADALDYQLRFNRNPGYFDGNSVARPSDHSPVLVGLDLTSSGPMPTTPAPIAPATPAPVVQPTPTTPAPIAPSTPAPVVQPTSTTPAPIAPSTPAPVVPATPAPIQPIPPPTIPPTAAPVQVSPVTLNSFIVSVDGTSNLSALIAVLTELLSSEMKKTFALIFIGVNLEATLLDGRRLQGGGMRVSFRGTASFSGPVTSTEAVLSTQSAILANTEAIQQAMSRNPDLAGAVAKPVEITPATTPTEAPTCRRSFLFFGRCKA